MPPQHPNPWFRRTAPPRFFSPAVDLVIVGALLAGGLVTLVLPTFRLTRIEVNGTVRLNPAYVAERTQALLARRWLGLLPGSSFFLARESELAARLRDDLRQAVPIASVAVDKRFPTTVAVSVAEEAPAAVLVSSGQRAWLDQQGIVAGPVQQGSDDSPIIEDTNGLTFLPGERAIAPPILAALPRLTASAADHAVAITSFRTVEVSCPFALTADSAPSRELALNANRTAEPTNTNAGSEQTDVTPPSPPTPAVRPCDRRVELERTTVIEMVTEAGWSALVETRQGVEEALDTLWLTIGEKLRGQQFSTVDLRFLPRVYYR